jgi:hypothetical protein
MLSLDRRRAVQRPWLNVSIFSLLSYYFGSLEGARGDSHTHSEHTSPPMRIRRPRVRNSTRHDNSKHRGGYANSHNTSTPLASHICIIYCQMVGCVGPSDTSYIGFEQPFIHSSDLSHVVDGFFRIMIRLKFACAEETVELLPGSKLPFKFGTAAVRAHWQ